MIKKILLGIWLIILMGFVKVGSVNANEGTAVLSAQPGYNGECFVASVFIDSGYSLLATCRNLPTALGPESNRLILWREFEDKNGNLAYAQVGELRRGKLSASIQDKFVKLFVTSEGRGSGQVPEGPVLVKGLIRPISFDAENATVMVISPTINPLTTSSISPVADNEGVQVGSDQLKANGNKLVGILKGVAKVIGFGFLLLLVIVGVLGFMARRRGKL